MIGKDEEPVADKQRREYVIHRGGTVEEHVLNVKGPSCEQETRETEERLGEVVHREYTREYSQLPESGPRPPDRAAAEVPEEQQEEAEA